VLKIKDNSNAQVRDPQIVQHQPALVISDSVDHFGIHDNSIKCDQIGDERTDLVFLVEDIEQRLLPERNVSHIKLDRQSIFDGFSTNP